MKIRINEDGITGRKQNPFPQHYWVDKDTMQGHIDAEWQNFEATVKSYTVIGSCKAGDVVEADLVWQYFDNMHDDDKWKICKTEYVVENAKRHGYRTRQVYLIVEAKPEIHIKDVIQVGNRWLSENDIIDPGFIKTNEGEVKEAKPEKSDDYKQGYIHALDSAAENDNLKIKRLEATIEIFRAENKSLSDQLNWYKKEYD